MTSGPILLFSFRTRVTGENTSIRREVKFESINVFNFDSLEYLG